MFTRGAAAFGVCEVCYWNDGDQDQKRIYYCQDCGAWICDACWSDLPRRAMAMARRKWNTFWGG